MKYFTIRELSSSDVAIKNNINNTPNGEVINNITKLIVNILDPLRAAYGNPIKINSGYRCAELNKKVKGSSTSQHLLGQAADITGGNAVENKKLFDLVISLDLPFDQCIDEYGYKWVHVSYSNRNRKQILHIK